MISQHYTASDLNTPYERAREKLAQEYCLYVRSEYLRDSYDAAVATIELTWADFAGPHIPTSLQHTVRRMQEADNHLGKHLGTPHGATSTTGVWSPCYPVL